MKRDLPFEHTNQELELPETTAIIRMLTVASLGTRLRVTLGNGKIGDFQIKKINWFYYSEEPWTPGYDADQIKLPDTGLIMTEGERVVDTSLPSRKVRHQEQLSRYEYEKFKDTSLLLERNGKEYILTFISPHFYLFPENIPALDLNKNRVTHLKVEQSMLGIVRGKVGNLVRQSLGRFSEKRTAVR